MDQHNSEPYNREMRRTRFYLIGLLALCISAGFAWSARRPQGLARALKDESVRQRPKIQYVEDGWDFIVRGDGRALLQKRDPLHTAQQGAHSRETCTGNFDRTEVETLIRLMVQRRLDRLPQKGFPNYVGAEEAFPWKLHVIEVNAGTARGTWVFETGEMNGHIESVPPDFAAVEDYLRDLRARVPVEGRPCPLAPEVE
jgi:hypothetical protein